MRRRGPVPICDVRPPLSTRPLGTRLPLERLASHRRPNTLAVYGTERAGTDLSGNLSRPDGRIVTAIPRSPLSRSLRRTHWNHDSMASERRGTGVSWRSGATPRALREQAEPGGPGRGGV